LALLDFLLLQITNKSNLTWPYLTYLASPTLTLPGATSPSTFLSKDLYFLHLMPDDFFKKLPKFVWINFGTAKVHLCQFEYTVNIWWITWKSNSLTLTKSFPVFQIAIKYSQMLTINVHSKILMLIIKWNCP